MSVLYACRFSNIPVEPQGVLHPDRTSHLSLGSFSVRREVLRRLLPAEDDIRHMLFQTFVQRGLRRNLLV